LLLVRNRLPQHRSDGLRLANRDKWLRRGSDSADRFRLLLLMMLLRSHNSWRFGPGAGNALRLLLDCEWCIVVISQVGFLLEAHWCTVCMSFPQLRFESGDGTIARLPGLRKLG
jgi:hypothetical protein